MTEPRVQELEQGHPCADDSTAWHSKQAQLFQLTPRARAARWWGESSADKLTAKSSRRDSGLSAVLFRPESHQAVRNAARKGHVNLGKKKAFDSL